MPTLIDNSEAREGGARLRSRGGRPVYEETYTFVVQADYKTQTRDQILTATPGLPQVGQTTSAGGFAACIDANAVRRVDNPLYWDVTCEFSSEVEEGSGSDTGTSDFTANPPEAWIPVYETKFERVQQLVTKDRAGVAIVNSAGQAFETGTFITRHIPIWEFYQFESATISQQTIIGRSETVNSATFLGRAAKTLLCIVLSSVIGYYYGQRRRLTQYQLKYDELTWQHKRLDVGTQYKSGTTLLDFTSSDGSIMLGSLNGSGGKQAAGTAPAILTFDIYTTNDFSFIRI